MKASKTWIMTAVLLGLTVLAGFGVMQWSPQHASRINVIAHFDNTNGLFVGDNVIVLGVKVGTIEKIEPQPDGADRELLGRQKVQDSR